MLPGRRRGLLTGPLPPACSPALLFWDTRVAGVSEQQAECSLIVFLRFKFGFFGRCSLSSFLPFF